MKIAIPTRDCRIDDHFGHCDHYTIYTIENKTIAAREELPSPQGCGCKSGIAADLQRLGVTALVRGCSGDIETVVKSYLAGFILDSGKRCAGHDGAHRCDGHGHEHTHECGH